MKVSAKIFAILVILAVVLGTSKCVCVDDNFFGNNNFREEGKIFEACSLMYDLNLYKDSTYEIDKTSGFAPAIWSGKFILIKDTLTLLNLNKEDSLLKSNRLLIMRYNKQEVILQKQKDTANMDDDTIGNVYQLDSLNNLMNKVEYDNVYFKIIIDSLKNYGYK
jgi:hypothetical protein